MADQSTSHLQYSNPSSEHVCGRLQLVLRPSLVFPEDEEQLALQDLYFDCTDETNLGELPELLPSITEIWLFVHRRTSRLRRIRNYFRRSRRAALINIAEQFVHLHKGVFDYPIGQQFPLSYNKEEWLLILKRLEHLHYVNPPYPLTRVILIRKGIPYMAR